MTFRPIAILLTMCIVYGACSKVKKLKVGNSCDPHKHQWHAVPDSPHKFFYCDKSSKKLKISSCPEMNGYVQFFDEGANRCFTPRSRNKRVPGIPKSSNIGEACTLNTDCKDNMYCPSGTCQCNPGYVGVTGASACLPTINPGQTGCTDTIQCSGGWPGTTCSGGVCTCDTTSYPGGAIQTQDGTVCVRGANYCPLPLYINPSSTAGTVVDRLNDACVYGSTSTDVTNAELCAVDGSYYGDIYDCIPDVAGPFIAGTTRGICCPSRALACIQPKMTAASGALTTETRYWFNSITGGCEPFLFDAETVNGQNSNAFLTIEHCLSYCGSACKHGSPRLASTTPTTTTVITRVTTCTTTTDCGSTTTATYTCQRTGSISTCCPGQTYICGASGARPTGGTPVITSVSPDVGIAPLTGGVTIPTRWAYSSTTGTCTSFAYAGTAGNFNNFFNQADCLSFCTTGVCDQGAPLKTATGTNQACSGSSGCPTTYTCKSNVCCPKAQTVCIQPKSIGSCSSSIASFWYNAATGDCEAFQYSGCGGNDNLFTSYAACITFCRSIGQEPRCIQGEADKDSTGKYIICSTSTGVSNCKANYECYFDGTLFGCCPVKSWTCNLPVSTGTACITPTGRWYYNTALRSCQAFTYGGCDGNSNNFINRDDCERYCGSGGCPFGGLAAVDSATNTRRVCSATSATCPSGYDCQNVNLGGSATNACCLNRLSICQQNPIQGGSVGAPIQRYYFNPATRTCTTFTYFGTGGNENNFATAAQCNNFCASAACLLGESISIDPNTQRAQSCTLGSTQTTCPAGYACRQDALFNRFVCCGSTDAGVCPTGEKAFIEAYTQAPRECRVGISGDCYSNFLCRPNAARGRNYCCAPTAGTFCPPGKAFIRDPTTQQPQSCFISTVNTCANGYSCQSTLTGQIQGFCCTTNSICPNNADFAVDGSQNPRTCTITTGGANPCPDGFTCQTTTPGTTAGYCCRGTVTTLPCGTLTPVLDPATNNARVCSASALCTSGTCTLNSITGISYCCLSGGGGTDPDGCGVGLIAYREQTTNAIRVCSIGPNANCPTGFSCQATSVGQSRCCGFSAGCPANTAAFISPTTGSVQSCSAAAPCTSGFTCSATTTGSVCCSTPGVIPPITTARCPLPTQTAYIIAGTTTAQTCNPGPCPGGYQCVNNGQQFLCCSTQANMCPAGTTVATNALTGAAISCMSAVCPSGFRCTYSAFYRFYYCCSRTTASVIPSPSGGSGGCPAGQAAFFNQGSSSPASCKPGSTGVDKCPPPFVCTFSSQYSTTICCRSASASEVIPQPPSFPSNSASGCLTGRAFLYPGTSKPISCDISQPNKCPTNYNCSKISDGTYQCCSNS